MMNKLEAPERPSCDMEASTIAAWDVHRCLLTFIFLFQFAHLIDHFILRRSHSSLRYTTVMNSVITGTAELLSGVMLLVILQVNFTAVCQSPTTLPLYFLIISTLLNGLICIFYLSRWRRERCVFFIDVQPTGIQWHVLFSFVDVKDILGTMDLPATN